MAHASYPSDNQLADLVEAATAAAGQEAAWPPDHAHEATSRQHYDGYAEPTPLGESPVESMGQAQHYSHSSREDDLHDTSTPLNPRKRKRTSESASANQFETSGIDFRNGPTQDSLSDARSAGVHSAAALFRRPSENSKKYTRPPMSKMFSSLQLSPENFLHLQAAAKTYMLDSAHPERRDTVGQRGRGDSEMVKLRLYNCVKNFLEVEGYGERFFGEHAVNEGMGARDYIWPQDHHKIISLVIPLLRRMVTNERQRQYAIETRKVPGDQHDKEHESADKDIPNPSHSPGAGAAEQELGSAPLDRVLDERSTEARASNGNVQTAEHVRSIDKDHAMPPPSGLPPQQGAPLPRKSGRSLRRFTLAQPTHTHDALMGLPYHDPNAIMLRINVVSPNDVRLLPCLDLPSSLCPNLAALVRHTSDHADRHSAESRVSSTWDTTDPWSHGWSLKVWLADGLVLIQNDGEWMVALLSAGTKDWMDGELRVIVVAP